MKKGHILLVPVLLLVVLSSGCRRKQRPEKVSKQNISTNVDIPMAEDGIKSFFDEDINEFALLEETPQHELIAVNTAPDMVAPEAREYTWIEEQTDDRGFKKVYFDFDRHTVRNDQEENLNHDIQLAKKMMEENKFFGKETPVIVIDGHACHSAGSRVYNLALSERRAKVLADKFIEAGIPQECIKIVGRGSEMPALIDGKPCDGNREQQWPNRRDELRIVYS